MTNRDEFDQEIHAQGRIIKDDEAGLRTGGYKLRRPHRRGCDCDEFAP
jgi:hypothetical protein